MWASRIARATGTRNFLYPKILLQTEASQIIAKLQLPLACEIIGASQCDNWAYP